MVLNFLHIENIQNVFTKMLHFFFISDINNLPNIEQRMLTF